MRQCGQNYAFDSSAQAILANWHSDCDAFIIFSPTTSPPTSLTATFNQQICTALGFSCLSFDVEPFSCSDSYTAFTDLKNCISRPFILNLTNECLYDSNISCKSTTAASNNIALFLQCQVCPIFIRSLTGMLALISTLFTTNSNCEICQCFDCSFGFPKPSCLPSLFQFYEPKKHPHHCPEPAQVSDPCLACSDLTSSVFCSQSG